MNCKPSSIEALIEHADGSVTDAYCAQCPDSFLPAPGSTVVEFETYVGTDYTITVTSTVGVRGYELTVTHKGAVVGYCPVSRKSDAIAAAKGAAIGVRAAFRVEHGIGS